VSEEEEEGLVVWGSQKMGKLDSDSSFYLYLC